MPLFLGFDCGTQGLTAILIEAGDGPTRVVFEQSLDFDHEFSELRHHPRCAPPAWRAHCDGAACDVGRGTRSHAGRRRAERLRSPARIRAISGSAQQHGTVYLAREVETVVGGMNPALPFADGIAVLFSRQDSPIWMDESTRAQCDAIDAALGGPAATARLTGSVATERFAGPQIRKLSEDQPGTYRATRRIHLVSSFLASLLAGRDAPIDPGDGAGMNLMDIVRLEWSAAALDATAPDLGARLPALAPSWTVAGSLAPYWQRRHGLPPADVVAWSGDNPCSLVGGGLVREADLGVSLGTSDTVFAFRRDVPQPGSASHVFGSPTGGYMALVCFRNGSLAREAVRDRFGLDWPGFSACLRDTPAGNAGALLVPWFESEITPRAAAGVHRYGLAPDDAAHQRARESSKRRCSPWRSTPGGWAEAATIVATGGASASREILQVMADVFDADVYQGAGGNGACLGAALRAWHAHEHAHGRTIGWDRVVAGITRPLESTRVRPDPAHAAAYRDMRPRYQAFERRMLAGDGAPGPRRRRT